jgi:hypothetical protein
MNSLKNMISFLEILLKRKVVFMERVLLFLQSEMTRPTPWGWFHWFWIIATVVVVVILSLTKNNEKKLKCILLVYGLVAATLEMTKQIIWTYEYDTITDVFTKDYQWYAAPFQICTTPIYVSIACALMKNCKIRNALLSYLAFVTILGDFMTIIIPDSCFVETIEINIHTMWLHCGGFVVSLYLLVSKTVQINMRNLMQAIFVFLCFVATALLINVVVYKSGVLNGETFNMFYISPYFISSLPVFSVIQQSVPYVLFLASYILALSLGAAIVCQISKGISIIVSKERNSYRK